MPTDIKSYEIKYGGVGKSPNTYAPFKMKAKNNDPMTKNYGPVAPGKMRAFGTKDSDMPDKVSTTPGMPYAGGVGESPNKFFGGGAGNLLGRMFGKGGGGGPAAGLAMAGADIKAKMAEAIANAKAGEQAEGEEGMMADAGGEGAEMAIPPHGDEAHTGGGAKKKMFSGFGNRISGGLGGMRGGFGSLFAGI